MDSILDWYRRHFAGNEVAAATGGVIAGALTLRSLLEWSATTAAVARAFDRPELRPRPLPPAAQRAPALVDRDHAPVLAKMESRR